jgi:hypothetical protein
MPVIGFLSPVPGGATPDLVAALRRGLAEEGYVGFERHIIAGYGLRRKSIRSDWSRHRFLGFFRDKFTFGEGLGCPSRSLAWLPPGARKGGA